MIKDGRGTYESKGSSIGNVLFDQQGAIRSMRKNPPSEYYWTYFSSYQPRQSKGEIHRPTRHHLQWWIA